MRIDLLLSLVTCFLFSFAFPPFKFGFLAYWALVPFFYLLENKSLKESFRWGYVTGLFISIGTIYWITFVTIPGSLATILIHPLYYSLYAMIHTLLRKRLGEKFVFAIPFVWTGIEYVKSLGELGFPWISLGYTQTHYLLLIQYASYTTVFGISFWLVLINVLVYLMLKNIENRKKVAILLTATILLFILPWMYGKQTMPDENDFQEAIEVALVQGNIDPYIKWDKGNVNLSYDTYERLSRECATIDPDLIVWPETATPSFLLHDHEHLHQVKGLINDLNIPLLTGTPEYAFNLQNKEIRTYNSAVLITPNSHDDLPVYSKMQLVPVAERVPYEDRIPILKDFIQSLEMGEGNFSPGEEVVVFEMPVEQPKNNEKGNLGTDEKNKNLSGFTTIPFATVICYESIFPDLVQRFIKKGAKFLVVITNDAWFGRDWFPWWLNSGMFQHAQMAIFRAIENRISIARCANTGVSMFIDPFGRTHSALNIFEEGYVVSNIPLRTETTFFTKHGNIFTKIVSCLGVLFVFVAFFMRRKHNVV
ncbi:MAG: apolipoprotein N-acyltransferase [bacterium]